MAKVVYSEFAAAAAAADLFVLYYNERGVCGPTRARVDPLRQR